VRQRCVLMKHKCPSPQWQKPANRACKGSSVYVITAYFHNIGYILTLSSHLYLVPHNSLFPSSSLFSFLYSFITFSLRPTYPPQYFLPKDSLHLPFPQITNHPGTSQLPGPRSADSNEPVTAQCLPAGPSNTWDPQEWSFISTLLYTGTKLPSDEHTRLTL
jgi:hypothetical protein